MLEEFKGKLRNVVLCISSCSFLGVLGEMVIYLGGWDSLGNIVDVIWVICYFYLVYF